MERAPAGSEEADLSPATTVPSVVVREQERILRQCQAASQAAKIGASAAGHGTLLKLIKHSPVKMKSPSSEDEPTTGIEDSGLLARDVTAKKQASKQANKSTKRAVLQAGGGEQERTIGASGVSAPDQEFLPGGARELLARLPAPVPTRYKHLMMTKVDLQKQQIGDLGVAGLMRFMLEEKIFVKDLKLFENKIGDYGAQAVANYIRNSP